MLHPYLEMLENLVVTMQTSTYVAGDYLEEQEWALPVGHPNRNDFLVQLAVWRNEVAASLREGKIEPKEVQKRIANFNLGYYEYDHVVNYVDRDDIHETYKLHSSFVIDENFKYMGSGLYKTLFVNFDNVNKHLISICSGLEANKRLANELAFDPSITLNIAATNFFNVLYQMTQIEYKGKPLIEIIPSPMANQFIRFCGDSKGKPISPDVITKCFTKNKANRRDPMRDPVLTVVIDETKNS